MRLIHFLCDDGSQLNEILSWVSLVAMPTCLRILCDVLLLSRNECTIWTWVHLRLESNFLRIYMVVAIVKREAEASPYYFANTITEDERTAAGKRLKTLA